MGHRKTVRILSQKGSSVEIQYTHISTSERMHRSISEEMRSCPKGSCWRANINALHVIHVSVKSRISSTNAQLAAYSTTLMMDCTFVQTTCCLVEQCLTYHKALLRKPAIHVGTWSLFRRLSIRFGSGGHGMCFHH